jgi:hypothetical protein
MYLAYENVEGNENLPLTVCVVFSFNVPFFLSFCLLQLMTRLEERAPEFANKTLVTIRGKEDRGLM